MCRDYHDYYCAGCVCANCKQKETCFHCDCEICENGDMETFFCNKFQEVAKDEK